MKRFLNAAMILGVALATTPAGIASPGRVTLTNPDWNITLTDYGYSDFMLDNTPGFEGREYLSGEWGAAVAYQVEGRPAVTPTWLEPRFIFPDWTTNSNFTVVTPIEQTATNAEGLPIAESVLSNGDLRVSLRYEILDTVVGTPMGTAAASSAGNGSELHSNRYVLKQTCTVTNISGAPISGLQLFQLLHGLNAQRGQYDDRVYAGPFGSMSHDVTLSGIDYWSIGAATAPSGLEDFLAFHASRVPSAFEIGHYGIEGNGADDHAVGKPSDGVHLSIEANWQGSPYSSRQGTDWFQPSNRWVSGAQRWEMGNLAADQSVSMDLVMSLRTGTRVDAGTEVRGGCNGGAAFPGGVDFEFSQVTQNGTCFSQSARADQDEISTRIAEGQFQAFSFPTLSGITQLWQMQFSGTSSGPIDLTFAYDPALLPQGFDPQLLCVRQFDGQAWQNLGGVVDTNHHTIRVRAFSLTVFVIGTSNETIFNVQAQASPSLAGSTSGAAEYADGASVTLVATSAPGYVFVNWTENGTVVSTSPSYNFVTHGNHQLQANFVPVGEGLAVSTRSQPASGGSTSGDGVHDSGDSVTVHAEANPGYKFSAWLLNGTPVSSDPTHTFQINADQLLVASFKPFYTVTAIPEPRNGGEILSDPAYEPGQLAVLRARANPGYTFLAWTQNGSPVSSDPTLRYTVTGNRTLIASFVANTVINATASPDHAGFCTGAGVQEPGTPVALMAHANPGYIFLRWTENGQTVSTEPSLTFAAAESRNLSAVFVALPALACESPAPGTLAFHWPVGANGWILQESATLEPDSWVDSTRQIEVVADRNRVVVVPESGKRFFRLRHP